MGVVQREKNALDFYIYLYIFLNFQAGPREGRSKASLFSFSNFVIIFSCSNLSSMASVSAGAKLSFSIQ